MPGNNQEKLSHLFVTGTSTTQPYTSPASGGKSFRVPQRQRESHGQRLLRQFDIIREQAATAIEEQRAYGIDAKNGKAAVDGWIEDSGIDALELAERFALNGVKRFIYTDIATDGMLSGPNLSAQAALCDRVPLCKVIASGGIACPNDVKKLLALNKQNLEGVIIGKALYDKKASLEEFIASGKA
jgi:phosphoribosylformimino-5-aminoimidazole carboxamide ribotide isomerase